MEIRLRWCAAPGTRDPRLVIRRRGSAVAAAWAIVVGAVQALGTPADAAPALFWLSEPLRPGEVALAYGGELAGVREVRVERLADSDPGMPPPRAPVASGVAVRVLQPSDGSLKFVMPATLEEGVFAINVGGGPRMANAPRVEWSQPTRLLPGLSQNETVPGSTVQIIGRNFLLNEANRGRVKVVLRQPDAGDPGRGL